MNVAQVWSRLLSFSSLSLSLFPPPVELKENQVLSAVQASTLETSVLKASISHTDTEGVPKNHDQQQDLAQTVNMRPSTNGQYDSPGSIFTWPKSQKTRPVMRTQSREVNLSMAELMSAASRDQIVWDAKSKLVNGHCQ